MPIAVDDPPVEKMIAMIGMSVSGKAVPTAARTDLTAPSASPSFRPNHSMPLVEQLRTDEDHHEGRDQDQDVHRVGASGWGNVDLWGSGGILTRATVDTRF